LLTLAGNTVLVQGYFLQLEEKAVVTANFCEVPTIEYPKLYLESILLNLLSNAIRYRAPNRITQIHFRTEIKNNEIILIVTDNG
jgi:signal transduction histidine kinase